MHTTDGQRNAPAADVMQGYSRAAVDDFLAAASAERSRLAVEIAGARNRLERATVALGMHQTMIAMLTETGRELDDLRRRTELQAARTIADDEARKPLANHAPPSAIDLTLVENDELPVPPISTPPTTFDDPSREHARGGDDDDYFGFLRGALADHEPLGPRPE